MIVAARVVRDCYRDSVALLAISARLRALEGITEASVTMATAANLDAARELGLSDAVDAAPSDVLVVVRAEHDAAASVALDDAVDALVRPVSMSAAAPGGSAAEPYTCLRDAAQAEGAALALISVPGPYAAAEARKAIEVGLHVMIFSDNVTVADEVALKRDATARGLLVMGPDCGTAVLDGVPLGFANVLRRGAVGLIGASGTGLQEVATHLHRLGGGVSQLIGTGGRDLSAAVGGLATLAALELLGRDPATEVIVLVSKPPDATVAQRVLQQAGSLAKPVVAVLLGFDAEIVAGYGVRFAPTLAAAAQVAATAAGVDPPARGDLGAAPSTLVADGGPERRWLRGLFSGGTLAYEAQLQLAAAGVSVHSNAPAPGQLRLEQAGPAPAGHVVLDLGADEYTRGRPHPMIDPSGRDQAVAEALQDGEVLVILLDVVLGHGTAADPIGPLLAVLAAPPPPGSSTRPAIVAHVCGTDEDPIGRAQVVARLEAAGVWVAGSNADAASAVAGLLRRAEVGR